MCPPISTGGSIRTVLDEERMGAASRMLLTYPWLNVPSKSYSPPSRRPCIVRGNVKPVNVVPRKAMRPASGNRGRFTRDSDAVQSAWNP